MGTATPQPLLIYSFYFAEINVNFLGRTPGSRQEFDDTPRETRRLAMRREQKQVSVFQIAMATESCVLIFCSMVQAETLQVSSLSAKER